MNWTGKPGPCRITIIPRPVCTSLPNNSRHHSSPHSEALNPSCSTSSLLFSHASSSSSVSMSSAESSHIPPLGATIHQLKIKTIFDALDERDKLYAHHLARAAWHGSRIIMRQVSPESPDIFDFIMDLYEACDRNWETLVARGNTTPGELASFLEYAATFLCNLGNFYVSQEFNTPFSASL